ncbi:MAG: metallophosphoesterase family protein [Candidatus Hodarchaeales archaeon]
MKIAFCSDNHIGLRFNYLIDPVTGISKRSLDFVEATAIIVKKAIEEKCKIFVICGDFYEHLQVGPTLRKIVREKIIAPIMYAGLKLIIIGGNHDSPQSLKKGAPYEDFSIIPGVEIARKPGRTVVELEEKKIGFFLLPYLSPSQIVKELEKHGKIPRKDWLRSAQDLMKNIVDKSVQELEERNCDLKIIVGHYYISGSRIRETKSPEYLPGEFEFKKDMLALDRVDLVVFGHIHLHQTMENGKIIVPGATERNDFGEKEDPRGFIIYDTESMNWKYEQIPARELVHLKLGVKDGDMAPTQTLLEKIPDGLSDSVVRIDIETSKAQRHLIDLSKLDTRLTDAFYHEYRWILKEVVEDQTILETFTLDPFSLFNEFIETNFADSNLKESILKKGNEILDQELRRVED